MSDTPRATTNGLESLHRLRIRLTLAYVVTLGAILVALGGGLFLALRHRYMRELELSLVHDTGELIRAARIREVEAHARGPVVDAVEELRIPDRTLYLVDMAARPVISRRIDPWIRDAALRAAREGRAESDQELSTERVVRLHAERFTLRSGDSLVAIVVADKLEFESRYAELIALFSGAALAAVVLVAGGGWFVVRTFTQPIDETFAFMRRFMADAAHELRTPITVLRSRAEIALQQPRAAGAYVDALRGIEAESQRMGRMVDDLLTLARADAGERQLERTFVYLDDVVADAVGAASAVAARGAVTLDVTAFEEAPVTGDATLLRQLVMILLDNAIKYTPPEGRVRVAVTRDGMHCMLRVADNGVGIAPEQLPHVFERFFRGDPARTRGDVDTNADPPTSGAGLGLAIARWIADAHAATITLTSAPGEGTVATVTFATASRG